MQLSPRRHGEIGRHKGLKIPRRKKRTGSSPVAGTKLQCIIDTLEFSFCACLLDFYCDMINI